MRYFLGANTADGFSSLYDSLVSLKDGVFLWIIKGGAGCGKSSFMKMIGASAERAGLDVEYAHCSGDPDSLDGVYIPALKTAYMDGTAPHTIDANLTAVDSAYIDLGKFYDRNAISEYSDELLALKALNTKCYGKAYCMFAAAGAVQRGGLLSEADEIELSAAQNRIKGIINRELGKKRGGSGKITRRFLSVYTCKGSITLAETAGKLCTRFCLLESLMGTAPKALMTAVDECVRAGRDIVLCPDPLTPEVPMAVLIPSSSLCLTSDFSLIPDGSDFRKINLDSKTAPERLRHARPKIRRYEKLKTQLLSEAVSELSDAKRIHDDMEQIYNPHVDFDGVYSEVAKHLALLGLK